VQYAGALTHPLPMTFYSTAGSPPFDPDAAEQANTNEPYAQWLDYVLALGDGELPGVVSTSYGDDEQSVPREYAQAVCDGFAQLGGAFPFPSPSPSTSLQSRTGPSLSFVIHCPLLT
jgi:tripeptidyl-peptidase-1